MASTIHDLPNEILESILLHLDFESILNFSRTSKAMNDISHCARNVPCDAEDNYNEYFISRWSDSFVIKLDLSGCNGVIDASALGNVHTLNLSYTSVPDVSALGNVHILKLKGCEIADVSALGDVHTLDLSYTEVDVSALGNVHTLIQRRPKVLRVSDFSLSQFRLMY